jgi:hypothetical protein
MIRHQAIGGHRYTLAMHRTLGARLLEGDHWLCDQGPTEGTVDDWMAATGYARKTMHHKLADLIDAGLLVRVVASGYWKAARYRKTGSP